MKKKLHSEHLISRFVTLIALMLISLNANAQIIYTDIVPDYTSENVEDFYNMDLNNDQTVDYIIGSYYDYYGPLYLQIFSPNSFNSSIVNPLYANPVPLNSGQVIAHIPSPTDGERYSSWGIFIVGNCYIPDPECYYDWENLQDKYLGLRFIINGHIHFGWARMDVTSVSEWTIKDYAYNATPNAPIMAGQMVLGVEESDFNKVKVSVANQTVSIFNLTDRTSYNLYTINGQKILQGELLPNRDSIDVQNLTTGLYILELMVNNSLSTLKRKILIP